MAQKLDLRKNVFSKIEYPSVINTTFTDLGVTSISQDILTEDNVTKFFEMYNDLFYAIPAEGDINSHEYLARTSGEYIDFDANEEEIEALQQEITTLREQLLEQQQINIEAITGEKLNLSQEEKDAIAQGSDTYSIVPQAQNAGTGTSNAQPTSPNNQGGRNNPLSGGGIGVGGGGATVGGSQGTSTQQSGGQGGSAFASDRRLKINIRKTGVSKSGINIYTFNFKQPEKYGYGLFEGVMAQEVPNAAIKHPDGHLMVDYSKTDVIFKKLTKTN